MMNMQLMSLALRYSLSPVGIAPGAPGGQLINQVTFPQLFLGVSSAFETEIVSLGVIVLSWLAAMAQLSTLMQESCLDSPGLNQYW